jgi:hypothetical protein
MQVTFGGNLSEPSHTAPQAVSLPVPGHHLPASLTEPKKVQNPEVLLEHANTSSVLHAVGTLIKACGQAVAGFFGAVAACIGAGLTTTTQGLWYGSTVFAGIIGTIPGGFFGLAIGAVMGRPLEGLALGASKGYHAGSTLAGVVSAIPLAIPYLLGSALLKGGEKVLQMSVGLPPRIQEAIDFSLFIERKVDWKKVWQDTEETILEKKNL